jgi:hypothetical protein
MSQPTPYWRFFNFMVRRVLAVWLVFVGSIMCVYFLPSLLDPKGTIPVNGVPESDVVYRLFAVLMPALMAVLGVLLYRVRPYPHGDES